MAPKEPYTGKDFTRYARKNFPEAFATFRDVYKCSLEHKTFLDENRTVHSTTALFVGHYYRIGGPSVWARATTTGVRYFSGKATESICTPIPEQHTFRIYFAAPYNIVLGSHDGDSRTAGRKAGHYFVELIIKVLFLLAGQIEQVKNPSQTDILVNFEYIIKQEDTDVSQPIQHVPSHSPMPYRLASDNPQTSLFDHISDYQAEIESRRAQEMQAHVDEVTRLRAERDEQELRALAAEGKGMKQRRKRKGAEEQIESLQGQVADLQAETAALKEQPADSDVGRFAIPRRKQLSSKRNDITHLHSLLTERKRTIENLSNLLAEKGQSAKKNCRVR